MLNSFLREGNCIKVVCGAGTEDAEYVKRLVYIYALAGVRYYDVSANIDVVQAAKAALRLAQIQGFINVSYGIKGDPHTCKAFIACGCDGCGACESICNQKAIKVQWKEPNYDYPPAKLNQNLCIGCGSCVKICPHNLISLDSVPKSITETLPLLVAEGIDSVELHIAGVGLHEIDTKIEQIERLFKGTLSICIDRSKFSDATLAEALSKIIRNRVDYTTIIQADGLPMSGTDDSCITTLQALAIGQIVNRLNLPAYMLLSGGTNSKTAMLAQLFNVKYHGISLGSYARMILNDLIDSCDFWHNGLIREILVKRASALVQDSVRPKRIYL